MKKANVAGAIKQYSGNIAAIARSFGVSRQTIYKYIEDKPDLKQLIIDERESMIDNVESTLYAQARSGNTTAMIFFLKTQGKGRGYVERTEITGKDGVAIHIKWEDDADSND